MIKHLLSCKQFTSWQSLEDFLLLIKKQKTENIYLLPKAPILASIFLEPSTRTRLSFEAAMIRIGGRVISVTESAQSSLAKGETIQDMLRVVSSFVDVIVLRSPYPCSSFANYCQGMECPIINAGDGSGEHPTQALLDIYTIYESFGNLDNLHFIIMGDLKNGRTVHSLIYLLGLANNIKITLVSPDNLSLPIEIKKWLESKQINCVECSFEEALERNPDVIYLTRLQKERMGSCENYGNEYGLTAQKMEKLPQHAIVLHPLPRQEELPEVLDKDHRSLYFQQAKNGLQTRMAILRMIVSEKQNW